MKLTHVLGLVICVFGLLAQSTQAVDNPNPPSYYSGQRTTVNPYSSPALTATRSYVPYPWWRPTYRLEPITLRPVGYSHYYKNPIVVRIWTRGGYKDYAVIGSSSRLGRPRTVLSPIKHGDQIIPTLSEPPPSQVIITNPWYPAQPAVRPGKVIRQSPVPGISAKRLYEIIYKKPGIKK